MLTDDDRDLMRAVSTYLHRVNELTARETVPSRTPLGDLISEHLGTDAAQVPVVQEQIADHRLVDADLALEALAEAGDGRLVGVTGGDQRHHQGMSELVTNIHLRYAPGPVDYAERATGPDSSKRVVSLGIRLLRFEGAPIALTQWAAAPQFGRPTAVIEVMAADPDVVTGFLEALRRMMVERASCAARSSRFSRPSTGGMPVRHSSVGRRSRRTTSSFRRACSPRSSSTSSRSAPSATPCSARASI